jgi:hypothetical protein
MRPSRSVQRLSSSVGTAVLASVAGACVAATLVGCVPPPKPMAPPPPPPPVPTVDDVTQTQQQFAALDPHARVGHVAQASPADHIAAVSGIPFTDVKVGDSISFTGPDHEPFATGTVIDLDDHTSPQYPFLIVDYSKSSTNGRDPTAGDLAIFIPVSR